MKKNDSENEKLINIKQNNLSNYSNYKRILSFSKNSNTHSLNDIFCKMYLKKNKRYLYEDKSTLFVKNTTSPIINSNEFSPEKQKEKLIQKYYIQEKNIYKNLLKKYTQYKEKNNLRNFSFSNNLINSKVNQYEENLKSSKSKEPESDKKSFWNEKIPELNIFSYKNNNNKKNNKFFHRTNISLKENLIDEEEIKIKINDMKNKGFNKVLNKYISNSIIKNLKSFNRIRHLIKTNGFSLNLNDIKNVYKESNNNDEKESKNERINTQKMMMIKRLEKLEKINDEKNENSLFNKSKEYSKNIIKKISRNQVLPVIKSEDKGNQNKLKIILDIINHKKDINELKYANKELIIKKEVNKYYEINKYNSFKDFFHDWSRKGNNYLTINDIEFFLNKVIKLSIPITKEDIKHIFFNKINVEPIDYLEFKKFFRPYEMNDIKDNLNNNDISNEKLLNFEKKIILRILNSKEKLIERLEKENGFISDRIKEKYLLNYQEFYYLIKNNLIFYQSDYFNVAMKKIYFDNFDIRKNKMNFLNFINKISSEYNNNIEVDYNLNNHSETHNSFKNQNRKKILNRINSLKDDIKNTYKDKILGKEESLNNSEWKIKNIIKMNNHGLYNFNKNSENNYLDKFMGNKNIKIYVKKKNKNSDIINFI